MTTDITSPKLAVLPTDKENNVAAQKLAHAFRNAGIATSVDVSNKKVGKKIANAGEQYIEYALVLGEDEITSGSYTVKDLLEGTTLSGTLQELIDQLTNNG